MDNKSPTEAAGFSELAESSQRGLLEAIGIIALGAVVITAAEIYLWAFEVPTYVMPRPSEIALALVSQFPLLLPHVLITLQELLIGFACGGVIGILLAGVVTQFPYVEKIITPYIILLVVTPMLALIPLLMLKFGFGVTPRIIAVALAAGPMVMINTATGFRRTDRDKISLASSWGASNLQIFRLIRVPSALPMIFVGLMVGSIFGLLTAVGAEMVGGSGGLGSRLAYYSSLIRMPEFFACVVILAVIGVSIYALFFYLANKFASWQT